jgi:hypothetical protein
MAAQAAAMSTIAAGSAARWPGARIRACRSSSSTPRVRASPRSVTAAPSWSAARPTVRSRSATPRCRAATPSWWGRATISWCATWAHATAPSATARACRRRGCGRATR